MNGGAWGTAATMANHSSIRTTQLYDRRADEVSLDEIEGLRVGPCIIARRYTNL
jgi:hypothetical protein